MRKGERALWIGAVCFALLAALCRALPGVRFSMYLSLCAAALCAVWVVLGRLAERYPLWRKVRRILTAALALGIALLAVLEGFVISAAMEPAEESPADVVIVLGAGVNGETPSLTLRTRIEAARAYLDRCGDAAVVLSGGQGGGERISEAECMRRALTSSGDERPYLLEDRSSSTAENFAFSRAVLLENGIDPAEVTVAVVSSDFHIFRAKLIAKKCGYGAVIGVPARLPWRYLAVNYYLREAFAAAKTVFLD